MQVFARLIVVFTAIVALAALPAVASEIYKWTDAEGNVHYGDRPDENVEAEKLEIQSRRTDPARVARAAQARSEARSRVDERLNQRAEQQASAAEQQADAEERARECEKYKGRLQSFLQSRRLYREDENGERVYLDEAEVQDARNRVQEKVEEYCNS